MQVAGIELDMVERGHGPTLLLLHGLESIPPGAPFLDLLARRCRVLAPASPGFGATRRPTEFRHVYDLVHFYLELIEALPGGKLHLVGFSFGGWLATEIAATSCHRLGRLVLVDALGIKVSGRETADILDIFNAHPDDVARARWREPQRYAIDFDRMSDEEIARHARDRESLCLYGWHPYMHNPHLARWLHRIRVPTLVLWGAEDRIVAPAYGRAYAGLIPGARFAMIDGAGHHPEQEQPEAFAARLLAFLEG